MTDPSGKVIYNWYNDYGVWEYEELTVGKAIGEFLFSPWKTLTGKTLLEELLKQGGIILDFIRKQFLATVVTLKNAGNELFNSDFFWPLVGGVAIVGAAVAGTQAIINKI